MQINYTTNKSAGCKIEYQVSVPYTEFEIIKNQILSQASQNAKLPGFRPGKVPLNIIEERLGKDLLTDALQRLVEESYRQILLSEKVYPITDPKVDFSEEIDGELKEKKDINLKISYGYSPEITLPDFKDVKIDKSQFAPTPVEESEIDKYFEEVKDSKYSRDEAKKMIEEERKRISEDNFSTALIQEVLKHSKFEMPEYPISLEVEHQEAHLAEKLQELGLTQEQYFQAQGTNFEDMKKKWRSDAETYLPSMILLSQVVRENKLEFPDFSDIEGIDERTKVYYQNVAMQQAGLNWLKENWEKANGVEKE